MVLLAIAGVTNVAVIVGIISAIHGPIVVLAVVAVAVNEIVVVVAAIDHRRVEAWAAGISVVVGLPHSSADRVSRVWWCCPTVVVGVVLLLRWIRPRVVVASVVVLARIALLLLAVVAHRIREKGKSEEVRE